MEEITLSGLTIIDTVKGMSHSAVDLQINGMRKALDEDKAQMSKDGSMSSGLDVHSARSGFGQPLTPEQKQDAYAQLKELEQFNQLGREVKSIVDSKLKYEDVFESDYAYGIPHLVSDMVLAGGAKQLGPMVVAGFNPLLYLSIYGAQDYEQRMVDNPNMNKGVASGMSAITAGVNFIIDNGHFDPDGNRRFTSAVTERALGTRAQAMSPVF
jgi:hypothetical protein